MKKNNFKIILVYLLLLIVTIGIFSCTTKKEIIKETVYRDSIITKTIRDTTIILKSEVLTDTLYLTDSIPFIKEIKGDRTKLTIISDGKKTIIKCESEEYKQLLKGVIQSYDKFIREKIKINKEIIKTKTNYSTIIKAFVVLIIATIVMYGLSRFKIRQ